MKASNLFPNVPMKDVGGGAGGGDEKGGKERVLL